MTGRRWPTHGRARARREAGRQRARLHGVTYGIVKMTQGIQQFNHVIAEATVAMEDLSRVLPQEPGVVVMSGH